MLKNPNIIFGVSFCLACFAYACISINQESLEAVRSVEGNVKCVVVHGGRLFGAARGKEPVPFLTGPKAEPVLDESITRQAVLVGPGTVLSSVSSRCFKPETCNSIRGSRCRVFFVCLFFRVCGEVPFCYVCVCYFIYVQAVMMVSREDLFFGLPNMRSPNVLDRLSLQGQEVGGGGALLLRRRIVKSCNCCTYRAPRPATGAESRRARCLLAWSEMAS